MYKFIDTQFQEAYGGRYYNANGFALAVVASVTKNIDWVAYIGGSTGSLTEKETLEKVLHEGCKLREEDARYFFPQFKDLRYRH